MLRAVKKLASTVVNTLLLTIVLHMGRSGTDIHMNTFQCMLQDHLGNATPEIDTNICGNMFFKHFGFVTRQCVDFHPIEE